MSDSMTNGFDAWVALVFGVDPRHYAAAGGAPGASEQASASGPAAAPSAAPAQAGGGAPPAPGAAGAPGSSPGIADIDDTITELEAQSRHLEENGIPAGPLDAQIKSLRTRLAAVSKPGTPAKQVAALHKDAAAALAPVKADADRQGAAEGSGSDKAVQDLRDTAADLIGGVTDSDQKGKLTQDLAKLDAQIKAAETATDPAKRAAARQSNDTAAQALITAAAAAANSKDAQEKLQAAYKKAITEKFGIAIGGKDGKQVNNNMHYDKAFQTFDKMPVGHVVHDSLKGLSYNKGLVSGSDKHGIGLFAGAGIQLGDFTDDKTAKYVNPTTKKKEQPNAYTITVLHELGHSVDARWGIMDKYGHQKGGGGWQTIQVGDLARQVADDLAPKLGAALPADAVQEAVLTLFTTHKLGEPKEGVNAEGWTKLKGLLGSWIKLLAAAYPYTVELSFNERGYIPHGNGKWMSYLTSERNTTHVTDYQWSAPGEWFAELYAICWYDKTPGPSGVHAGIRAYLPQADGSASAGAPA